jgi:hypothetical protein
MGSRNRTRLAAAALELGSLCQWLILFKDLPQLDSSMAGGASLSVLPEAQKMDPPHGTHYWV